MEIGIAITALVFSAASLTWQVVTFLMQGQRATVEVFSASTAMLGVLNEEGERQGVLAVTVRAKGRVPVQVDAWAIVFARDKEGNANALLEAAMRAQYPQHVAFRTGKNLPVTVDPGHSATFYIPREPVEAATNIPGTDLNDGHIEVYFGARRKFRDRKSVAQRLVLRP